MDRASTGNAAGDSARYGDVLFSHRHAGESERLAIGAQALDPVTIEVLQRLPLAPGSRCLEAGAGIGTIASWLARHCSGAEVVATDLDIALLTEHADPRVRVLRHDVLADDFPEASFDLIHARNLLGNLHQREQALARMVSWLAPGGIALIEDITNFPVYSSPYPLFRKVAVAEASAAYQAIGTTQETDWPRSLPQPLVRHGLTSVGLRVHCEVMTARSPSNAFWRTTLHAIRPQMTDGTVSDTDIERCLELISQPDFADIPYVMASAWGTRA
jgi:SAM-dependent methyltransferase